MAESQGRAVGGTRFIAVGLAAGWLFGLAGAARADRIVLRGGGQIRGKVMPDPKHADRVTVLSERGKTPLSFQKVQITEVVAEPSALDDYLTRRDATAATAAAQHDLGLWCEANKLPDLAAVHFEAALARDRNFAPAHQKLGHVKYGERWLTGDELREAQGLVREKGKWITREEKEQRDKDREAAAEVSTWARRIRVLREAIVYGDDARRLEAEGQLTGVRDPAAVAALVKVLGNDNAPLRALLARALGAIPGAESAHALVNLLLAESEPEVRQSIMNEVARRKESEVTARLVKAMKSTNPQVINRAAWALGRLDAATSVPALVGALVTTRYQTVMSPTAGGMGDGMSISATFGTPAPTSSMIGAPIAFNGSSVGYLTGPVVGPGVAAFGATSVPYYALPNPLATLPGGGSPFGATTGVAAGGGLAASRGPTPRIVSVNVQNSEVHAALVRMTGEDFGYDVAAWKRWVRTSFHADPVPARRIPQP